MNPENSSNPSSPRSTTDDRRSLNRRSFLQMAGAGLAAATVARAAGKSGASAEQNKVELPPLNAQGSEAAQPSPPPSAPREERVGFALVGLGHLTIEELLPAFAESKYAKPVALVSGNRSKAAKLAKQYGIRDDALYSYETYDKLADNPEVKVIYIVLPNSLHREYTVRGARAGKHILCEKPMANSVAECQEMIDACKNANVKLMVAYRSQYEPNDRAIVKAVREKKLGQLREFVTSNSQRQGDPSQWRLKKKMAGGGPLPDVGIYCINAARFLSGEEPTEVTGQTVQLADDPRFAEVETSVQFTMKFPSGYTATCSSSYDTHSSQYFRLQGTEGWAELSPAYGYRGLHLRFGHKIDEKDAVIEPKIREKNQFSLEIDHMAQCVTKDRQPHTPGEEGLQDQRIVEAIYESARSGRSVMLSPPKGTRGPDPDTETA